uniref:CSD domain-containing protein n=1 Tax=viral metagenome TaxID=1070528 RepID=A0A6C0B148_9ZZZZ
MSSKEQVGTSPLVTTTERLTGRVKWFNNKAGYGFITVSDGPQNGSDIFVHHSGISVVSEQYKYLVQGEYVTFALTHTPGGAHEYQAAEVSGIYGGKLMCETRRELRQTRMTYNKDENEVEVEEVKQPRSVRPPRESQPRQRGAGPRESSEWTMANSSTPRPQGPSGRGRGRPPRAKEQM